MINKNGQFASFIPIQSSAYQMAYLQSLLFHFKLFLQPLSQG
jgi:hypothetical protein